MTIDPEDIVRRRVEEAAATERKMPSSGARPAGVRGLWPGMAETPDDWAHALDRIEAFDAELVAELRRVAAAAIGRGTATPREVSRMVETMNWVRRFVGTDHHRRALWAWARMRAGGPPLRGWARANGVHYNTATRRANEAIRQIAVGLKNSSAFLEVSRAEFVVTPSPVSSINFATLTDCARGEQRAPKHWRSEDARPEARDYGDPEVAKEAAAGIEAHNERMRRRREIEAKRREKLGVAEGA